MRRLSILTCLAAALPAAAQTGIVREGGWWVRTLTGSEALSPQGGLHVSAPGEVVVEGAAGAARVSWEVKARARAAREADARRRLEAVAVRLRDRALFIESTPGIEASLKFTVPRELAALTVVTRGGGVEASALAGTVHIATVGGDIEADRLDGDLVAHTGGGRIAIGSIGGSARCTTGGGDIDARLIHGHVVFSTGGGDITVHEVGGTVRASSGGGRVRIGRAGSSVSASTSGGRIEVGSARGRVELLSGAGPVTVGAASGVRCETATGAIRLSNVSGSLRASTAIGSIVAQLAGAPLADSFLTTGGGDIIVVIPSNLGVKIRAASELAGAARRIVSEFPELSVQVRGAQAIAEGDLNGGGPTLRIAGAGGTIFIKRQ